jgi:hypothetical protein
LRDAVVRFEGVEDPAGVMFVGRRRRHGRYTSCPSVTGSPRRLPRFSGHPGVVHAMNERAF